MKGALAEAPVGESLTNLLSDRPRRQFDRGARLYHEGDSPIDAFFVHSGLVKLVTTADDGTEALVEFRGRGDFVGERSAVDGLARASNAIAVIDTAVTAIPRDAFLSYLRHDVDLAVVMLSGFSGLVRTHIWHMVDLTVGDNVVLVASRLVQLIRDPIFDSLRQDRKGTIVIEMPLSQQELASWAGVSHRTTTGVLEHLRDDGIISTSRLHLEVHDPAALAARCATRHTSDADERPT